MTQDATAAQQVLAIPELLEQILLHVATQAINNNTTNLEPVATTSRCQSVSRTFHATIHQSSKLQRLGEYAEPDREDVKQHRVLDWLFQTKLNLDFSRDWWASDSVQSYQLYPRGGLRGKNDVLVYTSGLEKFRTRYNSPQATWRQVKLQGQDSPRIEIELYCVASTYKEKGHPEWEDVRPEFELRLVPEDTLGSVFDRYCAVLDEAMAKRMEMA